MPRVFPFVAAVSLVALTHVAAAQSTSSSPQPIPTQKVRVGVFDSRLVALAYYNSDEHRRFMQQLMSQMQAAKTANDTSKIAELEFQGPALQNLMHYQVFSNASIPNVVANLREELPRIAEEAQVSLIVSKWDVAYRRSDVDYVDVTDALVRRFNPSEKVQRWLADSKTKEPIPLLEAVTTLRPNR